MARRRRTSTHPDLFAFRHDEAKRKSKPIGKIAGEGSVPAIPKAQYPYSPPLPPVLRFDDTGRADVLETRLSAAAAVRTNEILTAAQERWLEPAEGEEAILKVATRRDFHRMHTMRMMSSHA